MTTRAGGASDRLERLGRLDDYVSGHMDAADAAAFEEQLFDAPSDEDACFLDGLARMTALMSRFGALDGGARRADVDALRAAGVTVHFVDLGAGGRSTFPAWAEGTQMVVARLGVDVRGYDAVDVEVETADGRPIKTFRDTVCDPTDGALYAVCQEPLARLAFMTRHFVARVIGTRSGNREIVAAYDVSPP